MLQLRVCQAYGERPLIFLCLRQRDPERSGRGVADFAFT
jgi:hypothetical protein